MKQRARRKTRHRVPQRIAHCSLSEPETWPHSIAPTSALSLSSRRLSALFRRAPMASVDRLEDSASNLLIRDGLGFSAARWVKLVT